MLLKLVPVTVTVVPTGPDVGEKEVIVAGCGVIDCENAVAVKHRSERHKKHPYAPSRFICPPFRR
jgi:hypothetical protein